MFHCSNSKIFGTYPVEIKKKGKGYGRIQIPERLFTRIINDPLYFSSGKPLIFQVVNFIPGKITKTLADSQSIFVGLDEISSHSGSGIAMDEKLIKYLGLKPGDEVFIKECNDLPIAQKLILRPLDYSQWDKIPIDDIETIRKGLENDINKNYCDVAGSTTPRSELEGQSYRILFR